MGKIQRYKEISHDFGHIAQPNPCRLPPPLKRRSIFCAPPTSTPRTGRCRNRRQEYLCANYRFNHTRGGRNRPEVHRRYIDIQFLAG
ncbi:YhcH/YjgK/YiaL family protein [Escherichia coli]|nr:YhcH/YjgK/YiaL family protein [Escherichia coli]